MARISEVAVAPARLVPLKRHWYRNCGVPSAAMVKVALDLSVTIWLAG